MKRLMMALALLTIGYVAGAGLPGSMQAQTPAAGRGRGAATATTPTDPRAATNLFFMRAGPELRAENGKVVMWTKEELKTKQSHIQWAPEYRMTMTTRAGVAAGQEPTSGELHEDNTQIYIITGGSGTVLVEGKVAPDKEYLVAPGEHRGGPIVGGKKLKVKEGDVVSIPPFAWHIGYGDPGVPMTYLMVHVHTRQTIP